MIQIGNIKIDGAVLAPMAGFTSSAFRQVCREMGAGLVVSEMISAKALCFKDKKTATLISFKECERPYALQLFGGESDSMAEAAQILSEHKPDMIDINMGCPVPKIVGSGAGSALLRDHKRAGEIVRAVKDAVTIPLGVKIRLGWDSESICAVEMAKRIEDCGADLITVHGRTREQMYAPFANLEEIAKVKRAVKIPVIANGDIDSFTAYKRALEITGCDGAMIGRAALGNPFIFREISDFKKGKPPVSPSFNERMDNLRRLTLLETENKGEHLAMLELRRHLPFFFKGLRGASELRRLACAVSTFDDFERLLDFAVCCNEQNMEE